MMQDLLPTSEIIPCEYFVDWLHSVALVNVGIMCLNLFLWYRHVGIPVEGDVDRDSLEDDSDESDDSSYYYPQNEAYRESVIEAHRPSYVLLCACSRLICSSFF